MLLIGTAASEHRLPWQPRCRQALKVYRARNGSRAAERRAWLTPAPLPGQRLPRCPVLTFSPDARNDLLGRVEGLWIICRSSQPVDARLAKRR